MTMTNLRKQAAEGTLTGAPLHHVLNALEVLCETAIDEALERRGFGSDMDDEE
jgi:phage baseplate assembly protein W